MKLILLVAALGCAVLLAAGCSGRGAAGKALPADAPVATLSQILADPAAWNGKTVIVAGIVSSQCQSRCDFTLKDGTKSAMVFPEGFESPKLVAGRPIRVLAKITNKERLVIAALGFEVD